MAGRGQELRVERIIGEPAAERRLVGVAGLAGEMSVDDVPVEWLGHAGRG
jgi:hypothetical protein